MIGSDYEQVAHREIADILTAQGGVRRLEILELLCRCGGNVEALAEMLALGIACVSHHRGAVKQARLVQHAKPGTRVYCSPPRTARSLRASVCDSAAGHVPWGMSLTLERLRYRTGAPPHDEPILARCRGRAVGATLSPFEEKAGPGNAERGRQ